MKRLTDFLWGFFFQYILKKHEKSRCMVIFLCFPKFYFLSCLSKWYFQCSGVCYRQNRIDTALENIYALTRIDGWSETCTGVHMHRGQTLFTCAKQMYAICMCAAALPFEMCMRYLMFGWCYMPVSEKDTSKQLAVYFYHLKSHSTFSCHTSF